MAEKMLQTDMKFSKQGCDPSGLCICGTSEKMECTQKWCDQFCSSKNFPKGHCNPNGIRHLQIDLKHFC